MLYVGSAGDLELRPPALDPRGQLPLDRRSSDPAGRNAPAETLRLDLRSGSALARVSAAPFGCRGAPNWLGASVRQARLRGALTVIVGIQPDVAFAVVALGMGTGDVATALDLEEGLVYLNDRVGRGGRVAGMPGARR